MQNSTDNDQRAMQAVRQLESLYTGWMLCFCLVMTFILFASIKFSGLGIWMNALPLIYGSLGAGISACLAILASFYVSGFAVSRWSDAIIPQSDKRSLGGLLKIYALSQFSPGRKTLIQQLTAIFRTVDHSDMEGLVSAYGSVIRQILKSKDVELVKATLKGAKASGDGRLAGAVSQLAQGKHAGKHSPEVREAANRCLAHL